MVVDGGGNCGSVQLEDEGGEYIVSQAATVHGGLLDGVNGVDGTVEDAGATGELSIGQEVGI